MAKMTRREKRAQLGQMFLELSDFCKKNDISIAAVACYNNGREFVPMSISYFHECRPGALIPVTLVEMKDNPRLDAYIKTTADASRIDLKALGLDD